MSERVYVFNEQQLRDALSEWNQQFQTAFQAVSPPGSAAAAVVAAAGGDPIVLFLNSDAAAKHKLWMVVDQKIRPTMDPADIKEPKRDTMTMRELVSAVRELLLHLIPFWLVAAVLIALTVR